MIPDPAQIISAFLISTGIGGISAILGLGGGFLLVPSLTHLFGLDLKTAIGTSLAVTVFTALSAGIVYHSRKKICWKTGIVAAIPGVAGSILGAAVTGYLPTRILILLFSTLMFVLAFRMVFPDILRIPGIPVGPSFPETCDADGPDPGTVRIYYLPVAAWGFLSGMMSGTTGLSAGIVMVPALLGAGIPLLCAVGTSLGIIVAVSSAGAITHFSLGNYSSGYLIPCAAGVIFGAFAGAFLAPRVPAAFIRMIFGILVAGIALFMVLG